MTKKKMEFVCDMLMKNATGKNTPKTGLEAVVFAATNLQKIVEKYEKLNAVFQEVDIDWGECPTCGTPVLLEMGTCPVSGTILTIGPVDAVTTSTKKAAKKDASKKVSKKAEEVEEPETEEVSTQYTESGDLPEVEEELPDYDEIIKMKRADLSELITKHELKVDPDEFKKIKELREAVNEALDELVGEGGEEAEVEGEAETLEEAEGEEVAGEVEGEVEGETEGEEELTAEDVRAMSDEEVDELVKEQKLDIEPDEYETWDEVRELAITALELEKEEDEFNLDDVNLDDLDDLDKIEDEQLED